MPPRKRGDWPGGQLLWMEEGSGLQGRKAEPSVHTRLWAFSSAGLGLKACVCGGEVTVDLQD